MTACILSAPSFKEAFICSITFWQYSSLSLSRSFSRPDQYSSLATMATAPTTGIAQKATAPAPSVARRHPRSPPVSSSSDTFAWNRSRAWRITPRAWTTTSRPSRNWSRVAPRSARNNRAHSSIAARTCSERNPLAWAYWRTRSSHLPILSRTSWWAASSALSS